MKTLTRILAVSLALTAFSTSAAQQHTAESLSTCMIENSDLQDEQVLKDLIVLAMTDAPRAELQQSTIALGMMMLTLATVDCGMGMGELDGPLFEKAAETYGEHMGLKIMTEALAKIG